MKRFMLLLAFSLVPLAGCSGRAPIVAPPLDPPAAASAAFAEYDRNHDGYLDTKELDACPALKSALPRLGHDRSRLGKDELEARFKQYKDSNIGLFVISLHVTFDGKPLSQAVIDIEPEKFMGASARAAAATTDDLGRATPRTGEVQGCQYGCYRVRVSRKQGDVETIPARYNAQTTLGLEIGPQEHGGGRHDLRLSSK
jgi:hypothetical protein